MTLRIPLSVLLVLATASASVQAATGPGLEAFRGDAQLEDFLAGLKRDRDVAEAARRKAWQAELAKKKPITPGNTQAPGTGTSLSTGSIAGTTTSGGAVLVENSATGFKRELLANSDGTYRVGSLPTGTYTVTTNGQTKTVQVTIGGTASGASLDTVSVQGSAVSLNSPGTVSDGITNVQTQGVDEGGIVKKVGDVLVILRRGRLFTVRASPGELRALSAVDAYGPGIPGSGAWYDEMLVSGRTVVVIGYSYQRGGTEVGLFDLDEAGRLAYRATYHLRSDDYYSSRNFASRLVGHTLIFYTPLQVDLDKPSATYLPALRRWSPTATEANFTRLLPAKRIYRSGLGTWEDLSLHTVTRCDLSKPEMSCESTAVLGAYSGTFYVSAEAVYVWTEEWPEESDFATKAAVLRVPLDGSQPSALRVRGSPIDQMSFLERGGYLNVLVGAEAGGQRMWRAEGKSGSLALLRVPLSRFGDSRASSRRADYLALPSNENSWSTQNRYVGDWLLYGDDYGSRKPPAYAFALRYARRGPPIRLAPGHGTERIEALGADALLVGSQGKDLVYSSVRLDTSAAIIDQFRQKDSQQSESRTHGFFYRSWGPGQGLLGLPIEGDRPPSLSMQYLRNEQLSLHEIGQLQARAPYEADDGCKASCVDWYGGARPIFVGDRIYALMGYELVEGELVDGRVRETRRLDFKPPGDAKKR